MKLRPWIERNRERHEWTAGIQISLPFDTIGRAIRFLTAPFRKHRHRRHDRHNHP